MTDEVRVSSLPVCTFCDNAAEYDFKAFDGRWTYGCKFHYLLFRYYAELGVGKGQRLVLTGSSKEDLK